MQRLYIYDGALLVLGVSLGLEATLDLLAGQSSLSLWVMAVGSGGLIVTALYEAATTDPDDYSVSTYALFGLILAALLSLAAIVIRLVW